MKGGVDERVRVMEVDEQLKKEKDGKKRKRGEGERVRAREQCEMHLSLGWVGTMSVCECASERPMCAD